MYEVHQVRSDLLPCEIGCQVSSFIRLIWLSHAKGDDRFWVLIDPTGHVQHFYVAERGVLISHAAVIQRTITHADELYHLRGVGAVLTYPAFRHEGHGSHVVAAATRFILESDADIGMLFTAPALERFYGQCGWLPLAKTGVYFGDPVQPRFDDAFVMMLFVSDKARAHRDDFQRSALYVGASTW